MVASGFTPWYNAPARRFPAKDWLERRYPFRVSIPPSAGRAARPAASPTPGRPGWQPGVHHPAPGRPGETPGVQRPTPVGWQPTLQGARRPFPARLWLDQQRP